MGLPAFGGLHFGTPFIGAGDPDRTSPYCWAGEVPLADSANLAPIIGLLEPPYGDWAPPHGERRPVLGDAPPRNEPLSGAGRPPVPILSSAARS